MDAVAAWLGLIGGVVAIIVFLGASAVYLRGSRDKGTISTLETSNRALLERVTLLETDAARQSARISALERENATLLAQRPSAEAIIAIQDALTKHDSETRALLRALVQKVGQQ